MLKQADVRAYCGSYCKVGDEREHLKQNRDLFLDGTLIHKSSCSFCFDWRNPELGSERQTGGWAFASF